MNGRVYDPVLGKFLSADPNVQFEKSVTSYNRYSYVNNNPLRYTDPSGYFLETLVTVAIDIYMRRTNEYYRMGTDIAASVLSAYFGPWVAALNSTANARLTGASTSDSLRAGVLTYVSAEAFGAIGDKYQVGAGEAFGATHWKKILLHGLVGGVVSEAGGGQFRDGFAGAAFAQAFAPVIDNKIDVKNKGISVKRIIVAAMVGGTASVLSGGKFANGAVAGAFSRALNDELLRHNEEKNGGYRVSRVANGKVYNVRYHAKCGTPECLIYGANIDWTDSITQAWDTARMIETAGHILDTVGFVFDVIVFKSPRSFLFESLGTTTDVSNALLNQDPTLLAPNYVGGALGKQVNGIGLPNAVSDRIGTAAEIATDLSLESLKNN